MIKKIIYIILLLWVLLYPKSASAKEDFLIDVFSEYNFQEGGNTFVTTTIFIKNLSSNFYAKNYTFTLSGSDPLNIKASDENGKLPVFQTKQNEVTEVRVEFPEALTGKDKIRSFIVTYEDPSLAVKSGDTWEIFVPKLLNPGSFNKVNVTFSIPNSYGEEAYVSPDPRSVENEENLKKYRFEKEDFSKMGITAGFGSFQTFSFKLNYHLENSTSKKIVEKIAIPPDTSMQKMHYTVISPLPQNVFQDEDGNWLAYFPLSPKQKVDIKVEGFVQVFSKPRKFSQPSGSVLLSNTKSTQTWQSDNEIIRNLAENLYTPEEIYQYVTETLRYNWEKVSPETKRTNVLESLNNPNNSICTDFTDLFIAIMRAKGFPAREINGFAKSDNPKIEPLSLVSDVLHSWPEYWDREKLTWIPVDPTWGSTSGIDYFNKFDLKHFTFVIHGKDSFLPTSPGSYKTGNNPQKDVFVKTDSLPSPNRTNVEIEVLNTEKTFLFSRSFKFKIKNPGPNAIYDLIPQIVINDNVQSSSFTEVLPPFSSVEIPVTIKYGIFGKNAPDSVIIKAYRTQLVIPVQKYLSIIYQTVLLLFIMICAIFITYIKIGKIKLFKFEKLENIKRLLNQMINKIRNAKIKISKKNSFFK